MSTNHETLTRRIIMKVAGVIGLDGRANIRKPLISASVILEDISGRQIELHGLVREGTNRTNATKEILEQNGAYCPIEFGKKGELDLSKLRWLPRVILADGTIIKNPHFEADERHLKVFRVDGKDYDYHPDVDVVTRENNKIRLTDGRNLKGEGCTGALGQEEVDTLVKIIELTARGDIKPLWGLYDKITGEVKILDSDNEFGLLRLMNNVEQFTALDGVSSTRDMESEGTGYKNVFGTDINLLNRNLTTALISGALDEGHHHESNDGFCTCDYCTTVSMMQVLAQSEAMAERSDVTMAANAQFGNVAMTEERITISPTKEDAVVIRFEPAVQGTRTANGQSAEDTSSVDKRKSRKTAKNAQNTPNVIKTKSNASTDRGMHARMQKDESPIVLRKTTPKPVSMQRDTKKSIKLADVIGFQTIRNRLAKPLGNDQKPAENVPDLKDQKTRDAEEKTKKKEKSVKTEDKKAKKRAKDEKDRIRKPPYSEQAAENKKKLKAKELETKKKEKARKRGDIRKEFKSFRKNANEGIRKGVKQEKEADNGLLNTKPKKKLYGVKNSASKPKLGKPKPLKAPVKETKVKVKENVKPEAKKPKHDMETATGKPKNKKTKILDPNRESFQTRRKTRNTEPTIEAGLSTSPFATCMKQRSSYHKPKTHCQKAEIETKKQHQKTKRVRERHGQMVAMAEAAIKGKKAPERQVMAA